jgi:hypothetical protein
MIEMHWLILAFVAGYVACSLRYRIWRKWLIGELNQLHDILRTPKSEEIETQCDNWRKYPHG